MKDLAARAPGGRPSRAGLAPLRHRLPGNWISTARRPTPDRSRGVNLGQYGPATPHATAITAAPPAPPAGFEAGIEADQDRRGGHGRPFRFANRGHALAGGCTSSPAEAPGRKRTRTLTLEASRRTPLTFDRTGGWAPVPRLAFFLLLNPAVPDRTRAHPERADGTWRPFADLSLVSPRAAVRTEGLPRPHRVHARPFRRPAARPELGGLSSVDGPVAVLMRYIPLRLADHPAVPARSGAHLRCRSDSGGREFLRNVEHETVSASAFGGWASGLPLNRTSDAARLAESSRRGRQKALRPARPRLAAPSSRALARGAGAGL